MLGDATEVRIKIENNKLTSLAMCSGGDTSRLEEASLRQFSSRGCCEDMKHQLRSSLSGYVA